MDKTKSRSLLFISSWYPNRVKPLLGIFIKRRAEALTELYNVSALFVCSDTQSGTEELYEDNIYTIRVYYKKINYHIPVLSACVKAVRYIKAWRRAIRLYRGKKEIPDIITSNVIFPASLVSLYLKLRWRMPYIITEHWTGYFPEDGRYKGVFMKWVAGVAVKAASAVITDSNRLKERMLSLRLTNRYYSIPNVVNTDLFTTSNRTNQKPFKFIHISTLDDAQKNVSGIIRAFTNFTTQHKETSLTIVGDGVFKTDLQELANSLNNCNNIVFAGTKTGKDLVNLLNDADVFILFSNYENLPCVMLEALCCGLPVIATKTGDIPEYINTKNGILIDAGNEQELCRAMEQVQAGHSNYNPAAIRAEVVNKVTPEAVANRFKEVYNAVWNAQ